MEQAVDNTPGYESVSDFLVEADTKTEGNSTNWTHVLHLLGITGSLSCLLLVLPILVAILAEPKSTPINRLIGVDCMVRLTNIPYILYWTKLFDFWGLHSVLHCAGRITFSFTTMLLCRLLTFAIALYRWVFVCHPTLVLTDTNKRTFSLVLSGGIFILTTSLGSCAFFHIESYRPYQLCRGNVSTINFHWDLPLNHPFQLSSIICFFGHLLVSPLLYALIFCNRKTRSSNLGLSERSLKSRNKENLVTARFSFLCWLVDVCLHLAVVLLINVPMNREESGMGSYILATYLVLFSCCSPLLYFMGIRENRKTVRSVRNSFKMLRPDKPSLGRGVI